MTDEPMARVMTPWERTLFLLQRQWIWFRRRLPYIVWYGQEIDVCITFLNDPLLANDFDSAMRQLHSGKLHEAELALREIGVRFDTGMGCKERDWEWDWSLKGPVSVRFRSRAQRPYERNVLTPPKATEG
jgi:hypothetical protein